MAQGGEFYRSVGGRGEATILQAPDYSGIFAQVSKNLASTIKQKEDEKAKKQAVQY